MPTIFDHLNNITFEKGSFLGDEGWNISMINRYTSMNQDYCELVNIFQKNFRYYSQVPNRLMYASYKDMIPKRKMFLRYIKNENKPSYGEETVNAIASYYQVSIREAQEYSLMLSKEEIKEIKQSLGI